MLRQRLQIYSDRFNKITIINTRVKNAYKIIVNPEFYCSFLQFLAQIV